MPEATRSEAKEEVKLPEFPNFKITGLLGRGGMATVYRARQLSLDRDVAIKVLHQSFSEATDSINLFVQEAKACARFVHPGLVKVYDAKDYGALHYFVMEYIRGYTMNDRILRKTRLPLDEIPVIIESVAEALSYAWRKYQVVHCDIKPDNIMVDADGSIKVTDLGIARSLLSAQQLESPDEVFGTPDYMSPEQICGMDNLDCRSDIYSLGAAVYHMVTGQVLFAGRTDHDLLTAHIEPFFARDIRDLVPEVTVALSTILNRMLAKNRDLRYPNWETLLEDMRRLYVGEEILATPLPTGESSMMCRAG